jgi:cobalt-zinc-cadmium efflux system membrane fusion protein
VNAFGSPSGRSRAVWFALIAIGGAVLFWGKGFIGFADGQSGRKEQTASIEPNRPGKVAAANERAIDLSEKQAASLKIGPVAPREFALLKTAVGTIDFNENLLVQVFSQYQGKILKAFYNIGDEVQAGTVLFTIDSPDLLAAESALLAAAGVLELQRRVLGRALNLLKAGGSAQKDVDQATSDQQTAEGNFKAAKDAVRIFGKNPRRTQARIDTRCSVPDLRADRGAQCGAGISDAARRRAGALYGCRFIDDVDAGKRHRNGRAGLQARPGGRGPGAGLSRQGLQRPRDGARRDD